MLTPSTTNHRALLIAFAVWTCFAILILAREAQALGAHETYATLSYYLRAIRYNAVGRFLLLPFGCWIFLHICIAPRWLGTNPNNWRLWLGLALGFGWAVCETAGWFGMRR